MGFCMWGELTPIIDHEFLHGYLDVQCVVTRTGVHYTCTPMQYPTTPPLGKSYRDCAWVPLTYIEATRTQLLRNFLQRRSASPATSTADTGGSEGMQGAKSSVYDPAYEVVDRVFARMQGVGANGKRYAGVHVCWVWYCLCANALVQKRSACVGSAVFQYIPLHIVAQVHSTAQVDCCVVSFNTQRFPQHSTRFFRVKWKHLGYAESTWEEEATLQSEEDKVWTTCCRFG